MRIYTCDKCGAEFRLGDGEFDDVCPECCSDMTTLVFQSENREGLADEFDEADEFEEFEDELDEDELNEY